MIYKELDPFASTDKFQVAGRKAEEQMAHYLRRFFGGSDQIDVINYLRIELAGEVAQIDHLVLHPHGLVIVESKSVSGSVQIKDDGQWIRWFNKAPQGMRSPITQARMQSMLLRDLLDRAVKQKGFFADVPIDVLVAISDQGTIQWPSTGVLPEVAKADQIPDRILAIGKASDSDAMLPQGKLPAPHRRTLADFLCKMHRPQQESSEVQPTLQTNTVAEQVPTGDPGAVQQSLARCRHCGGTSGSVEYGKYGYYFACASCEKNTSLKFSCPACGGEGRVRKQGHQFFAECKGCNRTQLFFSAANR